MSRQDVGGYARRKTKEVVNVGQEKVNDSRQDPDGRKGVPFRGTRGGLPTWKVSLYKIIEHCLMDYGVNFIFHIIYEAHHPAI